MAPNNERIQKIQSLAKKGEWKKAYKEAKFSLKLSNSSELRLLVIDLLWNWIKEQVKRNQYEDAKLNVRELIQIDANSIPKNIRDEFPPIFLQLGLNSLLPDDLKTDTTSADIQTQIIDQYILRDVKTNDILPETLAAADQIKRAFELIELRQDSEALKILASIPFRSPASEWRLLIRGLIAHYNNDDKTANDNWQRLNNTRPTGKIAANLQNLFKDNKSKTNDDAFRQFNMFNDGSDSDRSRKIELIDNLRIIGDCIKSKKYKEVLVRLPMIRQSSKSQNDRMYGRILRLIQTHFLQYAQPVIIRQFVEQNLPLPLDPNGNRTFAILIGRLSYRRLEFPLWMQQGGFDAYWTKFIEEDIDQIESFSPEMKARAKSIAFQAIIEDSKEIMSYPNPLAIKFLNELKERIETDSESNLSQKLDQKYQEWATAFFTKAVEADPTNISAFNQFNDLLNDIIINKFDEERKKYIEIQDNLFEKIWKHNPNENKILYQLFNKSIEQGDLNKAAEYMENIERNNPISKSTISRKIKLVIQQCRQSLEDKNLSNAEKYLTVFEKILTSDAEPLHRYNLIMLALKFIFYTLSDDSNRAKKILEDYNTYGVGNQLPIVLAILFESRNIMLSKRLIEYLKQIFDSNIIKLPNSAAAGAVADLILGKIDNSTEIMSTSNIMSIQYISESINYICRLQRVTWKKEKDLVGVCVFMWRVLTAPTLHNFEWHSKARDWFCQLVQSGKNLFPNSPILTFLELEVCRYKIMQECMSLNKPIPIMKAEELEEKYKEYINIYGKSKENPELAFFIRVAEERAKSLLSNVPRVVQKFSSELPK